MRTRYPGSNGGGGFTLTTMPWQLPAEVTEGHPLLDTRDFLFQVKLMKIDCISWHPAYHSSFSVPLFAAIGMVDRCRPILQQFPCHQNSVLHALFLPVQVWYPLWCNEVEGRNKKQKLIGPQIWRYSMEGFI